LNCGERYDLWFMIYDWSSQLWNYGYITNPQSDHLRDCLIASYIHLQIWEPSLSNLLILHFTSIHWSLFTITILFLLCFVFWRPGGHWFLLCPGVPSPQRGSSAKWSSKFLSRRKHDKSMTFHVSVTLKLYASSRAPNNMNLIVAYKWSKVKNR